MKGYENSKVPRLFELMQEKKIKSSEIAEAVGISRSAFTEWKMGRSLPSGKTLVDLATFLATTPDYLLGKTDSKTSPSAEEDGRDGLVKALLGICSELSEEGKQKIFEYAQFIIEKEKSGK